MVEKAIKRAGMGSKMSFSDCEHSRTGIGTVCAIFKSEKKSTRVSMIGSH